MEEQICKKVIELVGLDPSKFGIEHRTPSYTTLIYCDNDFFRVKYTDGAQWISIRLTNEDCKALVDDPRFSAQTNKRQSHWRARINRPEDIELFKEELKHACRYFMTDTYTPRDNISNVTIGFDFEKGEYIKG